MTRTYTLLGADGRPYLTTVPGTFGGYRPDRIYGRLDCWSARNAIARGGYTAQRVFFAHESDAVAAGYRPCAKCMPDAYAVWKAAEAADDRLAAYTDTAPSGRDLPQVAWSEADLASLRRAEPESLRTVAQVLDILSAAPGEPVSLSGLATELGLTSAELSGRLGYLSKWTFAERGRGNWPLLWADVPASSTTSECWYVATPEAARLWLEVTGP
ncbi:Ada metal-binding domain-containing protein [Streptomyces sp. NBC_01465]|uniref:Ada metal-binding domain-containing protein n=1 Tax=Streptomyces sp. NBC_01465 TaxID=2903878 RepID=UPI002E38098C|nr:Ada metal-binding domain-containing protein [Streptomyces sp. NBC_01465]